MHTNLNHMTSTNLQIFKKSIDILNAFTNKISTDMFEFPVAFTVLLFDFKSEYFKENRKDLPRGYKYVYVNGLKELSSKLRTSEFQVLFLNYDVDAKTVNKICAEVNRKFPSTKVIIGSKKIDPKQAQIHSRTEFGASGYYEFPLDCARLDADLVKLKQG